MGFSSLKRNDLGKLTKALEELGRGPSGDAVADIRMWQPTVDKAGNGYAVIHFLPTPEKDGDEGLPWARKYSHGFQGPGGWYIEECPTTINKECPVCQYNKPLWDSGIEANREIVRKQKRKLAYIANIYVITDSGVPTNDKQVKLFRFGKKIFDKINEAMNPEFKDEKPMNPFHFWEGASLKLKVRNVEGYRNYDKSEFASAEPLFASDSEAEAIWKKEYSLTEFTDLKQYKTHEFLKAKLEKVLGADAVVLKKPTAKLAERPTAKATIEDDVLTKKSASDTTEDEDLSYFQKLADEE